MGSWCLHHRRGPGFHVELDRHVLAVRQPPAGELAELLLALLPERLPFLVVDAIDGLRPVARSIHDAVERTIRILERDAELLSPALSRTAARFARLRSHQPHPHREIASGRESLPVGPRR